VTQTQEDEREIRAGGQRIRVRMRPGEGVPLVLCNGIGASLEVLAPLSDALAPRPVIRFDVPGCGGSPNSPLPYTFPYLAWVLGKVLDELGAEAVDVLGFSWGGALAQQFAFQNPRRCRRLILVATGTGALMVPAKAAVLAKMATPRRFVDRDYMARIADEIYGGNAAQQLGAVAQMLAHQRAAGSRRGYVYQLLAGAVWTSLPALPFIRQRTLIVAGTDDPLIPVVNARIMHRLLPHARLALHPGGHIDLVTTPEAFAPVIERFLAAGSRTPSIDLMPNTNLKENEGNG
jgi:poly(3-hydroxyalkanoate) depolymerase